MNQYDVIVLGSGGAGLSAALAAAVNGARVLVIEASSRWGGSTSVSAGEVWVPANHYMSELGIIDSTGDALQYCLPNALQPDSLLVETFVRFAPEMAVFVEENSPINWRVMTSPDSFAERPGGRASGRHLEVSPIVTGEEGPLDDNFWLSNYPAIFTNDEVFQHRLLIGGQIPPEISHVRIKTQRVCTGIALIVGLMQGCRSHGVKFQRNSRASRLLFSENEQVVGVVVKNGCLEEEIRCDQGVILATGGFEWDETMRSKSPERQMTHPVSPPLHYGDGLSMAEEVGAQVLFNNESWVWPVFENLNERWPGTPLARNNLILAERCMPHVLWVNKRGERFVNESSHNCALALAELNRGSTSNLPAWAIFDNQYRSRYPLAGSMPGEKLSAMVVEATSLADLARAAGINKAGFLNSIKRFNEMVAQGKDTDFSRGESAYDRHYGDPSVTHPNLGSIEQAPFFAMPVYLGAVGTKSGARTNELGRVLDESSRPISGLWAAGNAMSAIIGPGTIAPGLTLGLALTWGYIAGQDAASS